MSSGIDCDFGLSEVKGLMVCGSPYRLFIAGVWGVCVCMCTYACAVVRVSLWGDLRKQWNSGRRRLENDGFLGTS